MKKCSKCFIDKDTTEFHRHSGTKDGLQPDCKECKKGYRKKWYEANRGAVLAKNKEWLAKNPGHSREWYRNNKQIARNWQLNRDFGISLDQYNKMLQDQSSKCKICNVSQDETPKNFAVDHCHLTNKIRGLLCQNCNLGIGYFRDNHEILNKALKYLKESQ